MSEPRIVDAEFVEVHTSEQAAVAEPVRRLPEPVPLRSQIEPWRGDVRAVAMAAAGGAVAGAATVAAVRAVKAVRQRPSRRARRQQSRVVASRSFLVDVHLLGR